MKKHYYDSLTSFYNDVKNTANNPQFEEERTENNPRFRGLSLSEIRRSQYSYKVGVDKLRAMKDFEFQRDEKIKYWDSFDGFDIDIDRMYSDLDFLRNERKVRKLPKTVDIFINVGENANVNYDLMLNKTYAALKIIDHLESLGVRTALYACISGIMYLPGGNDDMYVEICIKKHADNVNLGALCTAISPWFFRYWFFLWIKGRFSHVGSGIGRAQNIPLSGRQKGIFIDQGMCLLQRTANNFIESINIENISAA